MEHATSLPDDVVHAQLARIIGSRQFCNAPRLSRFLAYVVEQSLCGRADRLKGYTIGLEVFDKGANFDPQTDTIVRVQARALRQKLDQYYSQDGAHDPVYIAIAKGGYEPTFFVSWNDDIRQRPEGATQVLSSRKPSIAVLPFAQFGPDADHAFLAHGLTERTISNLSRFKDLSVFSGSTTERAKLDRMSVAQMYDLFHPDFVLEGSFCVRADSVETCIELVAAAKDEVIMTDRINVEKMPSDIYTMLDELAARIAARIAVEYGPIGHFARRTGRPGTQARWDTYCWISRYFESGVTLDQIGRQKIKAGLTKAVTQDPESSDAHAALAMLEIESYRAMSATESDRGTLEAAMKHALRAVRLDPESAMAHQSLAIAYFHDRRFVDFRASVARAVMINPGHSDMLATFGICHAALAEWDDAIPMLDRAAALNPLHPGWYRIPKAMFLAMTHTADAAIAELEQSPLPGFYAFHFMLLWFHVEAGDMSAAQFEKDRLLAVAPDVEKLVLRHFETWCLNKAMADRILSAFRKVGLMPSD